jgi:hypothetical protein
MADLIQTLVRIGAIQFGQFEAQPGQFDPVAIHLELLPSYPSVLRALAQEVAPLVRIDGLTHLLAAPSMAPIGVAVSLAAELPLVYPLGDTVEGAYDFNVPTILLTGVLRDGAAESELIRRVKPLGLDVKAVVALLNIGASSGLNEPVTVWRNLRELLSEIVMLTPSMRQTVQDWMDRLQT